MLKKILAAMMLVGLGLNVLASEKYTYNWTFEINNATYLPEQLPSDMVGYIVGTDANGVQTEIVRLTLVQAKDNKSISGKTSTGCAWDLYPAKSGPEGVTYYTYTPMTSGEGYFASFAATLWTEQRIAELYDVNYGKTGLEPDYSKRLTLVLESATLGAKFRVAAHAGGASGNLQFTADFVPEPTSGLLVLMGLAGLALKRKKAA